MWPQRVGYPLICGLYWLLACDVGDYFFCHAGTSEGAILVYSVSAGATQIELTKQLQGHSVPISDLIADAKGRRLISADDQGNINLWQDISTSSEPTITINDSR